MVLGGNSDRPSDVEMIDASKEGGICTKPADFPDEKERMELIINGGG